SKQNSSNATAQMFADYEADLEEERQEDAEEEQASSSGQKADAAASGATGPQQDSQAGEEQAAQKRKARPSQQTARRAATQEEPADEPKLPTVEEIMALYQVVRSAVQASADPSSGTAPPAPGVDQP